MTESGEHYIECRSYTHARRHPFVIGSIGGWHLPSPLTPTQLIVCLSSFGIMFWAAHFMAFLGGIRFVLMLLIPGLLTWSIRHLRMEGRAPIRMLMGYMTYKLHPKNGIIHGHSHRDRSRVHLERSRIYMVNFPDEHKVRARRLKKQVAIDDDSQFSKYGRESE